MRFKSGLTLLENGVIGSLSGAINFCIRPSRIIKFVADVSSSISSVDVCASNASMTLALVMSPLALSVEKCVVSFLPGKLSINGLMLTF